MSTAAPTPADRRVFPRNVVSGRAHGKRVGYRLSLRKWPRIDMEIRDLSLSGMSALSSTPLKQGERLTLQMQINPATGQTRIDEWNARGRVVRCEPSATGYRIAFAFESLMAANQAA